MVATAAWCLTALAQSSRTTSQEGGFEITKWQTKSPAPAGRVGWKTTDHLRRVGNTDATRGESYSADMTLGGFVDKCPTFDGKVPGDFQYMINATQIDSAESQPTDFAKIATAQIVARLNDDGTIRELEMEASFVSAIDGVRGGVAPFRRTFRLGQMGEPDLNAMIEAVTVTGNMAIAAVMWSASMVYFSAQSGWLKPDECVEIEFDPPSDTLMLGPSESKQVRTTVRTKAGNHAVPRAHLEGGPLNQIGQLAPRVGNSGDDGQLPFTYTASADPKKGHGYGVGALSRAGAAKGEWRIIDPGFEGTFKQTEVQPQRGTAGYGTVKILQKTTIEGRLVWSPERQQLQDDDLPHLPSFEGVRSTFYVPTDGEISVHVEYDAKGASGVCRFSGSKVFPIAQLSPRALGYLSLEVADDGRYKMSLGMVSGTLPIRIVNEGCRWLIFPIDVDSVWNDAAIVIGHRQGQVTDDRIKGEVSPPIVVGPYTTTGSWSFVRGSKQPSGT